ncbi:MAG TPA: DUF1264 domain-containing protein [Candidatus Eisenbacteria bacterium]|nr:DUF1264 domain-containing protein [Candidatus Eisenbacteria bacterium]
MMESSTRNNNSITQIQKLTLIVSITALVIFGFFIAVPSTIIVAQLPSPPSSPSSNTTKTATSTAPNATATTAKPVDGYNTQISAVRHVFDDPSLRVLHYCKPNDKIPFVCQLYDSTSRNATLIGVEYIITADQYKSLPEREKPNWLDITHNKSVPMFSGSADQVKALWGKLMGTHGKVIMTWNPRDKLPAFPPQVEQETIPFMLNATVKPEIHAGSFNQTLKY